MPTTRDPVEFTRLLSSRQGVQRCGNRVQLEDTSGADLGAIANPLVVTDAWELFEIYDGAMNDSDKTFTVPTGYEYQVLDISFSLATTATAGDRQMVVRIGNASAVLLYDIRAGAVQAASLTRYYTFAPALADLTSFRDTDWLMTPLPVTLFLSAGETIRVYDNNAVAAAADDLLVSIRVARRAV